MRTRATKADGVRRRAASLSIAVAGLAACLAGCIAIEDAPSAETQVAPADRARDPASLGVIGPRRGPTIVNLQRLEPRQAADADETSLPDAALRAIEDVEAEEEARTEELLIPSPGDASR